MRNLKKILALVLALVMSLSLMATASAADFKDASDISENYQTAVNVLEGLKVFKGYAEDNTFRPKGEITRAEVATIIYRIATGDAEDAQASIYTNMTTSFTDLDKAEWARGYVNYCHNAQIIKGESATKFNPNGKITGYATLAMILRAMGYGKNGEFEGTQWEYQTAAKAKEIGLIDNVIEAQLGSNAPRELVAEILFRALLTEMVDYTVLNGYVKNGKTLGYEKFKLEDLQGVVVANEYANLYSTSVLANGKTNLEVAKDDIRSLDVATEITDIGMRQHVYITGSTVLDMDDTDLNKVTETGAATDISTASKFSATAEMSQGSGTEFYTNFGRSGYNSSDYRIEYEMSVRLTAAQLETYREFGKLVNTTNNLYSWFTANDGSSTVLNPTALTAGTWYVYHRVIPVCAASVLAKTPASQISSRDMDNIQSIFYRSNGRGYWDIDNDKTTNSTYVGRVYVATQTSKDISDTISYNEFVDTYINDLAYEINWGGSDNGAWVKFIDNDLDGVCDYAFKTVYTMDKAMGTYTKGDNTYIEYNAIDEGNPNYVIRYMGDYTPAVGDVVLAAPIDGQYLVEKANDVTKTVNNYNWREDKITTTDSDEYGQSGDDIGNVTGMQEKISTMADKTEYIMYFDHFGYVRAYELPGGTQYALLTEIYANNNFNGNIVRNTPMTVELTAGDAATAEYTVGSSSTAEFVALVPWTYAGSVVGTYNYNNWLQPAIAHLGVTRTVDNTTLGPVRATPNFGSGSYQFWTAWRQIVRADIVPGVTSGKLVSQEFNYGTQYIGTNNAKQDNTVSFTNVAAVNINDTTATLKGAAQLRLNSNGTPSYFDINDNNQFDAGIDQYRYAVDYVQLTRDNVVAKQTMYKVNDNYSYWSNKFVNATHDTEYYIVHNNGVEYFKDYVNMPKLDADNYIHAAYAVARDTSSDSAKEPYWVADVIVYEVRDYTDLAKTNISLAYFNESRTSDQVQLLKTLTNAKNGPEADLTAALRGASDTLPWGADRGSFADYAGYGFYHLWNATEVTDGAMTARKIEKITSDFNKNGIYAGYVDRVVENGPNGGYLTINVYDANGETPYSVSVTDNVYTITTDAQLGGGTYNEANKLRYTNLGSNQVHTGDLVIWQGKAPTTANWVDSAYIVDLGNPVNTDSNWSIFTSTASFLLEYNPSQTNRLGYAGAPKADNIAAGSSQTGLWQQIVSEQKKSATSISYNVTVERVLNDDTRTFGNVTLASNVMTDGGGKVYDLLNTIVNTSTTDNKVTPAGYAPVSITTNVGTLYVEGTTVTGGTASGGGYTATATSTTPATITGATITTATLTVPSNNTTNVKVVIKYVPTTYSVTGVTKSGNEYNGISQITANSADVYGVTTAATVGTGLTTARVGDNIRLRINLSQPLDAASQDLEVTVTFGSGSPEKLVWTYNNGENACYVDFTMKADNAKISAKVVNKPTTITVTGAADAHIASVGTWTNAAATSTGAWSATTQWAAAPSVVVTAEAGWTLGTPVVTVNGVTVTDGVDYNWTAGTGTVAFVLTKACDGKNVTVTFPAATEKHYGVTFATAAMTTTWPGQISWGLTSADATKNLQSFNGATPITGTPLYTDTTGYLTAGDKVYFIVTGTDAITAVVKAENPTGTDVSAKVLERMPSLDIQNGWAYCLTVDGTLAAGNFEVTVETTP